MVRFVRNESRGGRAVCACALCVSRKQKVIKAKYILLYHTVHFYIVTDLYT